MNFSKLNFSLLIVPLLIFSLGFVTILSTAPDKSRSHLIFFIIGIVGYAALTLFDYYFLKYYWKYLLTGILILLLLTFIIGEVRFGASSWLSFGLFVVQPSEFAKIVAIITLAALLTSIKNALKSFKNVFKISLSVLVITALVLVQPDLGTALVIVFVFAGMMFYAGLNNFYFLTAFALIGIFSSPVWTILKDYQKKRVLVFFNPTLDVLGSGYNVLQSVISVGSGRLLGKGFGLGTQSHLGFLPVYWTDFIFAAFAEEWGFIGVFMLILLYMVLLITLLYVAHRTQDPFGSLLCVGVFIVFFVQFAINVGMNLGLMPVTGVPLSLVSHGGSSMITSMLMLGLIQSVWVHKKL